MYCVLQRVCVHVIRYMTLFAVQLKYCPCRGKLMGYFCLRKLFSAKDLYFAH